MLQVLTSAAKIDSYGILKIPPLQEGHNFYGRLKNPIAKYLI